MERTLLEKIKSRIFLNVMDDEFRAILGRMFHNNAEISIKIDHIGEVYCLAIIMNLTNCNPVLSITFIKSSSHVKGIG